MSETVLVAILSLVGTFGGSLLGILAANKLINYRIGKVEEKDKEQDKRIDDHNKRIFIIEGQMIEAQHDIKDIKKKIF